MFFSYDPNDGIEFHDTAAEAKARAEKYLDDAEFHAADSDWHWYDNEEQISWGEVLGKVSYNDRELTEEEKAERPDYAFIRNPTLDDIRPCTPAKNLPPFGDGPRRKMLIEIEVTADFEKRLDNQWMVEREINADRWKWRWAEEEYFDHPDSAGYRSFRYPGGEKANTGALAPADNNLNSATK